MILLSSRKMLQEAFMGHGEFQSWLAEADGLSAPQREEAARVLAEPASLAAVLALLEARIEGRGAGRIARPKGRSFVVARTGSGAIAARVAPGLSMP